MSDHCLSDRLGHYLELTDAERKVLAKLEEKPEEFSAGSVLFEEGEELTELFIVQHGWLMSSTLLVDGARQIFQLHFPGDMMGAASIAFERAAATLTAVTDTRVCRFPREGLGTLFADYPRLAALFYAVAMLENVDLCDRLKSLGRTSGKSRLAVLFLSLFSKMRILEGHDLREIHLPLKQADMGDAVGLTEVHVNRLLKEMEREGLIARDRRQLRLLDEPRLIELAHYTDRYSAIDTGWFPPPTL